MSIATAKTQAPPSRIAGWPLALGMIALTLCVFGAAVWYLSEQLRSGLRQSILQRDGEFLRVATYAVETPVVDPEFPEATMVPLLEASKVITNIFAIRLYDGSGKMLDRFPVNLTERKMTAEELAQVIGGHVASRFEPEMDLRGQFSEWDGAPSPVLQTLVPLKAEQGPITGYAEFLVYGHEVASALAAANRGVMRQSMLFGISGGTIVALALGLAFSRLNRANRLLAERTAGLLRANHELALAAKTSAVGAVAAHLIHALKNPLFGIQMFVTCAQTEKIKPNETHWQAAANSAQRMQKMIADIVRILREDAGTSAYEVTLEELAGILKGKVATTSEETGVRFETVLEAEGVLPNREANLMALALTNLIQNSMQACPAGTAVELKVFEIEGGTAFELRDQGPGLPEHVKKTLFSPTASSKAGGTGIGLAITKQLVSHMGGQVELVETGPKGTTFRLTLPTLGERAAQLANAEELSA
jgi:signal transduction histidine kinase